MSLIHNRETLSGGRKRIVFVVSGSVGNRAAHRWVQAIAAPRQTNAPQAMRRDRCLPAPVLRENVVPILHYRVACEPALGIVRLWWLII
jgi:hypothetical protein